MDLSSLFRNKKGQGLSLTVIIVAAIALIVLVILIMVFTGRIGVFSEGVDKAGDSSIAEMKIQYGQCHPGALAETQFSLEMGKASGVEDEEISKAVFREKIADCKSFSTDKGLCEAQDGCRWD